MFDLESYYFSILTLPNILVAILIFATGLFVFIQNRTNPTHIAFFLLCISINFWLYGRVFMYSTANSENALSWARFYAFFGVVNIAPMTHLFSVHWLNLYERQKRFVQATFILSPLFYFMTAFTPYGIKSVHPYFWGFYPVYGPVCKAFLVYFLFYFMLAFSNFFREYHQTKDLNRKKQVKFIGIAFVIAFLASADYIPKVIPLALYPFGYLCVLVWILVIAFAIVKYRTLDIQTVIHKTIMWLLASSVLGAPMVLFFYFQKSYVYELPPAIYLGVLIFSFILVVLYTRHIQPRIDHFFQRRQWDLTRAMEQFNDALVTLRSLEEVVDHILRTAQNLLYTSNTSLLIRNEQTGKLDFHTQAVVKGDPVEGLDVEDTFIRWLEQNDSILFGEYLGMDPRLEAIAQAGEEYFQKMRASICVPMVVNKKLVGMLNLGKKENLRRFYPAEISFLHDFRRSAAIAVSNALHLIAMQENLRKWNEELEKKVTERTQQLEQTQAQLVQAEKLATIGTLAGGVAHEINNPLTAVLTNAQILKMTATGEDVESIELIEEGAKRCQVIIQNLLKYARKTQAEEPRSQVDVHQMIQNVCSLLEYQLKQENVKLVMDLKPVANVEGVSNELGQVLTNLIVNARDAVRKIKREGEIMIRSFERGGRVFIEVEDNGTGIEEALLKKIFDPFFTTKEVGGGTGLGLAVSYGIIQKYHGQVDVESEPGKGTKFIIQFPGIGTIETVTPNTQ